MTFHLLNSKAPVPNSWLGYTLCFPSLTKGNIGQLSLDVLIASTKAIKIGIWDDSENLLPYVAADADATKRSQITGTVCFGAEFYVSHELKTVFLQIRTLILNRRVDTFVRELVAWAVNSAFFSRILVITSEPGHRREDDELSSRHANLRCFTVEPGTVFSSAAAADQVRKNPQEETKSMESPLVKAMISTGCFMHTTAREDLYASSLERHTGVYGMPSVLAYGDASSFQSLKDSQKIKKQSEKAQRRAIQESSFLLPIIGAGLTWSLAKTVKGILIPKKDTTSPCPASFIGLIGVVASVFDGDNRSLAIEIAKNVYTALAAIALLHSSDSETPSSPLSPHVDVSMTDSEASLYSAGDHTTDKSFVHEISKVSPPSSDEARLNRIATAKLKSCHQGVGTMSDSQDQGVVLITKDFVPIIPLSWGFAQKFQAN